VTYDPLQPAQPEPMDLVQPGSAGAPAAPVSAGPVKAVPSPTKSKGSPAWVNVVLAVAVAVAIGGVAFAVGRSTAPTAASTGTGRFGNGNGFPTGSGAPGFGGQGGFGGRGGPTITGTVKSIDGTAMTVTTASGQTIQVTLDPTTVYSTNSPATESAVTPGSKVQVRVAFTAGAGAGFGNGGNGGANGATPSGPLGTANSVTVVP